MKRGIVVISIFVIGVAASVFLIVREVRQDRDAQLESVPSSEGETVSATQLTINDTVFTVEVADNTVERALGLQHRESLPEQHGMLFIFDSNQMYPLWMKNTLIPLDAIWIEDDIVVGITENIQPEPGVPDYGLKKYQASRPVNNILEINAGEAAKFGISEGDAVVLDSEAE
ncbi:DUF192 domain-containing protein [Patescibacteria group bacterium]